MLSVAIISVVVLVLALAVRSVLEAQEEMLNEDV
jgi:hypothetical protein